MEQTETFRAKAGSTDGETVCGTGGEGFSGHTSCRSCTSSTRIGNGRTRILTWHLNNDTLLHHHHHYYHYNCIQEPVAKVMQVRPKLHTMQIPGSKKKGDESEAREFICSDVVVAVLKYVRP